MYEVIVRLKSRAVGLSPVDHYLGLRLPLLWRVWPSTRTADALLAPPPSVPAARYPSRGLHDFRSLTSSGGDCIDVAASRVTLNLNNAEITGANDGVGSICCRPPQRPSSLAARHRSHDKQIFYGAAD